MVEHNEYALSERNTEEDSKKTGLTKFGVFATTTVINSSATMLKDKFYAKHFGTVTSAIKVPMLTYGLWGLRDCMVIGSSFILPDIMSGILQEHTDLDKDSALRISQFACPIASQFVSFTF